MHGAVRVAVAVAVRVSAASPNGMGVAAAVGGVVSIGKGARLRYEVVNALLALRGEETGEKSERAQSEAT